MRIYSVPRVWYNRVKPVGRAGGAGQRPRREADTPPRKGSGSPPRSRAETVKAATASNG